MTVVRAYSLGLGASASGFASLDYASAGWPWRAVEGCAWREPGPSSPLRTSGCFIIGERAPGEKILLPFSPMLRGGFIPNVLIYTACFALFWRPRKFFHLIRERRVRRGLCLHCGYDLRGSAATLCPECGAQVGPARGIPPQRQL
jgi:hypothetical protein